MLGKSSNNTNAIIFHAGFHSKLSSHFHHQLSTSKTSPECVIVKQRKQNRPANCYEAIKRKNVQQGGSSEQACSRVFTNKGDQIFKTKI